MKFLLFFVLLLSTLNVFSQSVSGKVVDKTTKEPLEFVSVRLESSNNEFEQGVITNTLGRFTLTKVKPGNHIIRLSFIGYEDLTTPVFVGELSEFLELNSLELTISSQNLNEVQVTAKKDAVESLEKMVFSTKDNISQAGGSVLQSMQNLPGVSVQEGKVLLRGNSNVAILIDGKQSALTGFGGQASLENIPASAIEKIEIINNPSAKYDANGNAGIINIIYKKEEQKGFNGTIGFTAGLGALWVKQENLPTISPQYQRTPKINPNLSLNYKKGNANFFLTSDYLLTHTLYKNEFVTRTYNDGTVIDQQTKRNRNTVFTTNKIGVDLNLSDQNTLSISGLVGTEDIIDKGEEPFFIENERTKLWSFLEDEFKTTVVASTVFQHKFLEPGHNLALGFNYTFHREDEKYFFETTTPDYKSNDSFALISDEHVYDINIDYAKPLRYGRFETGLKFRKRDIPTNMQFFAGENSQIDVRAGGKATYSEIIPAVYGNYVFEKPKYEAELGLRVEHVNLQYYVNPDHPTYKSDGYHYTQPFPNLRFAYKLNPDNKIGFFINRRVDRPNEVDIRIFPKYDDVEIIKVGNPALKPQFTTSFEINEKANTKNGYIFSSIFYKSINQTITRIGTTVGDSPIIYNVFQNAGKSHSTGLEFMWANTISKKFNYTLNLLGYYNQIDAFTVTNLYPEPTVYSSEKQSIYSGNAKLNLTYKFTDALSFQSSIIYLAPDLIPQGRIEERFSIDAGAKKTYKNGEVFINCTDLFNTLRIKRTINGNNFSYLSTDYYETQVFRIGFKRKF